MLKLFLQHIFYIYIFDIGVGVSPSSSSFSSNMTDDIFLHFNYLFTFGQTTTSVSFLLSFCLLCFCLLKICIFITIVITFITSSLESLSSQQCGLMQILFSCCYFVHTTGSAASALFSFSTKGKVHPKFTFFLYLRRVSASRCGKEFCLMGNLQSENTRMKT